MKIETFKEICMIVGFFLFAFGVGLFDLRVCLILSGAILMAVGYPRKLNKEMRRSC